MEPQPWIQILGASSPGFYCLEFPGGAAHRLVVFAAALRKRVWASLASPTEARKFALHLSTPFDEGFLPLHVLLGRLGLPIASPDVHVFALQMKVLQITKSEILLYVEGAQRVERPPRAQRETGGAQEEEISDEENDSPLMESDLESDQWLASSSAEEPDLESECSSGSSSASEPDDAAKPHVEPVRAAPGAFVLWNNPYFTISNYADSKAAHAAATLRARLADKWAVERLLGVKNKSKTIQIKDFDRDAKNPQNSRLLLRCWMLYRINQNEFLAQKRKRQQWYDEELTQLQKECQAIRGHSRAEQLIRQWLPAALP